MGTGKVSRGGQVVRISPSRLADLISQWPAAIELDHIFNQHHHVRILLTCSGLRLTNLEIAKAAAIVRQRQEAAERKAHGKQNII